jgi:Cu-Zn family superoxide dismutase
MPNFTVAANGTAQTTITNKNVTMGAEPNSIYAGGGTALIVHEKADDQKTDPSGNAGNPIACGAITK